MSAFTLFTAGLACFASMASAYTKPVGDAPSGNPITTPGFGSIVKAGEPYKVRWEPTTQGKVTLVLLKGPAQNLAVVGPIAESIDNSGSYTWTPATDLTEGPTATTGYGIQLIVDATGQFQYTTQFGISNPHGGHSSADNSSISAYPDSSASASSSAAASTTTGAHEHHSKETTSLVTLTSTSAVVSSTAIAVGSTTASVAAATTSVATTIITSAVSASVAPPSRTSSTPSGTASARATSTGGAASFKGGLFGVAAFAGAAVLVM